jgi:hypothetical protein
VCKATSCRLADRKSTHTLWSMNVTLGEYSDSKLAEYSGSSVQKIVCAARQTSR